MIVKVKRCEIVDGERQDGTPYTGVSAIVIFGDKQTAARIFIREEVCDPLTVQVGDLYDLYRDEKGNCLVFDKYDPEKK